MLESKLIIKIIKETECRENNANNTMNVLLTAYFPVALKLRPAALYRLDEFSKNVCGLSNEEKSIAGEIGLVLIPWTAMNEDLRRPEIDWYFITEKSNKPLIEKIKNIDIDLQGMMELPRVLDYPVCCAKSATEDSLAGIDFDVRGTDHVKLYRETGRKIDPLVYFTWGFTPCKPNCEKALEKGHRIYSAYLKVDKRVAEAYKAICEDWIRVMGLIAEEPLYQKVCFCK